MIQSKSVLFPGHRIQCTAVMFKKHIRVFSSSILGKGQRDLFVSNGISTFSNSIYWALPEMIYNIISLMRGKHSSFFVIMQHTQCARYFQSIFPGTSLLLNSTSPFFLTLCVSQDQRQTMTIFCKHKTVRLRALLKVMKECLIQWKNKLTVQFLSFLCNWIIMVNSVKNWFLKQWHYQCLMTSKGSAGRADGRGFCR